MRTPHAPVLASLALAMLAPHGHSQQAQILQIYDDSLTTFQPSAKTPVNDVRPRHEQRGVNIDGSLRAVSLQGMSLQGNPFETEWVGQQWQDDLRIDIGAYAPADVDISLPAAIPWVIGRTYNAVQLNSSDVSFDSDGPQGRNWFQTSQMELVEFQGSDDTKDVIALVYGADRYIEFHRTGDQSAEYKAKNGAAGCLQLSAGTPDTYTYTDQVGRQYTFFGFDAGVGAGQIWKITDATWNGSSGNISYVGDKSSASTALGGLDSVTGCITTAYDSADRRYTYTYVDDQDWGGVRLTRVVAETKTGGTWSNPTGLATVGQVDYDYYKASHSNGDSGDLKLVTVTTPLSDSGVSQVKKKHYRYWEGSSDGSSNWSTGNPGYVHQLKYIIDFEGARRYDWEQDAQLDDDFLTASSSSLEPYAAAYFEYNSSRQVSKSWRHGQCGCSGGGSSGLHEYTYESSGSTFGTGYDTAWKSRTVVKRPDASYQTQYFDETSQGLSEVVTDVVPTQSSPAPKKWVTHVERDSLGCITRKGMPSNLSSYTHSSGSITASTSGGLSRAIERDSSGNLTGFALSSRWRMGRDSQLNQYYFERSQTYSGGISKTFGSGSTGVTVVRPLIASDAEYTEAITSGSSGANTTSRTYTAYSGTLSVEKESIAYPAVSTTKNGSGSAEDSDIHYTKEGWRDIVRNEDDTIDYSQYSSGQGTAYVQDALTGTSGGVDILNPPNGFTSSGTPLRSKTVFEYDAQGRLKESGPSFGSATGPYRRFRQYVSRLADHRVITLWYANYTTATPTYFGPVEFRVLNQAGRVEAVGTIAVVPNGIATAQSSQVDESKSDPLEALTLGSGTSVASYHTYVYDETGAQLEEERAYYSIPSSGEGTSSSNYDPNHYGYDNLGNRRRVKAPHGAIERTVFDQFSRPIEQWIGTNDYSLPGGEQSGTNDMVQAEKRVYDGGNAGDGYLTERTAYAASGQSEPRTTEYTYNVRGNLLLEEAPLAPHSFHKVDNLGRRIATALYSSIGGIALATDDPTTEAGNRLALTQRFWDERGEVWKAQTHKIDAADGSDDDNLSALAWYDSRGRRVKVAGRDLVKTAYDRLGRVTDQFTLATDNDTSYGDVDDVSGDIVEVQDEIGYSPTTGAAILEARISRHPDDFNTGETTGALDTDGSQLAITNSSGYLKGRAQIRALWYDTLQREKARVEYGTYGGQDFDRSWSSLDDPPSSSTVTAPKTSTAYSDDGDVFEITDPRGKVARYERDDLGRPTKEIRNYVDGTPNGTDEDVTVKYEYSKGLRTKLIADLPSGETDQETVYTYGTTKGTSAGDSRIGSGDLLQKVAYPDSSGSTDVVTYAYNVQGEVIWRRDQAGNIIELDRNDIGRPTQRRVTTLASGFDGAVRRVATTYDGLHRLELVTQYDNAAVGSGSVTDEVKYGYDGWGNLTSFLQDRDSTVGVGSGFYEVSHQYLKATGGRRTLRRELTYLPNGSELGYTYSSTNGRHDDVASRLTKLSYTPDGGTAITIAEYDYLGMSQVVGTSYPEISVMSKLFDESATPTSYPDLDALDRVVNSRWTKDLSTTDRDFYSVSLTYDASGNVTKALDFVHVGAASVHLGFSALYSLDSLDRITEVKEGYYDGSTITDANCARDEQWGYSHTGNWNTNKVDLNGDLDWSDANELNDTRTHNTVNELAARDINSGGGDDHLFSYDSVGNLTDDGKDYEYKWDPFGRMREIRRTDNQALVAEYRYNGLGFRIAVKYDTDADGDVDGNDLWYYDAFNEKWQQVARFRGSDSAPKEELVHHAAGADGLGNSSYIDLVACRLKDASSTWTTASDGVLDERVYICQNWRADVSAVVYSSGNLTQWIKYSAYGIPFGLPGGDLNSDGSCTAGEVTTVSTWGGPYDVRADVNLDGVINTTDSDILDASYKGTTLGRGKLSTRSFGLRRCYAGQELITGPTQLNSARRRVLSTSLGRWLTRDKAGYVDGVSLYEYVRSSAVRMKDPSGLKSIEECISDYYKELGEVEAETDPETLDALASTVPTGSEAHDAVIEMKNNADATRGQKKSQALQRLKDCMRDADDGPMPPGIPVGVPGARHLPGTEGTGDYWPPQYVPCDRTVLDRLLDGAKAAGRRAGPIMMGTGRAILNRVGGMLFMFCPPGYLPTEGTGPGDPSGPIVGVPTGAGPHRGAGRGCVLYYSRPPLWFGYDPPTTHS